MGVCVVLFDMDNTLIDFYKMKISCLKQATKAMRKHGLKMKTSRAISEIICIYRESENFDRQDAFQEFLKRQGITDNRMLSAAIIAYRRVRDKVLKPYDGIIDVLKFLKYNKLRIGVVTDAPEMNAWIRLTAAGISDYFNKVIGAGTKKKPSSIPFRKALEEFGCKAENTLFIGDSIKKDIYGANKVGMKTVLAKYGEFLDQKPVKKLENPDYVANNVDDIRNIVKEIFEENNSKHSF